MSTASQRRPGSDAAPARAGRGRLLARLAGGPGRPAQLRRGWCSCSRSRAWPPGCSGGGSPRGADFRITGSGPGGDRRSARGAAGRRRRRARADLRRRSGCWRGRGRLVPAPAPRGRRRCSRSPSAPRLMAARGLAAGRAARRRADAGGAGRRRAGGHHGADPRLARRRWPSPRSARCWPTSVPVRTVHRDDLGRTPDPALVRRRRGRGGRRRAGRRPLAARSAGAPAPARRCRPDRALS